LSGETDSNGEVTFAKLGFNLEGAASQKPYRMVFVCDGINSAQTADITVQSSVAKVLIKSLPVRIPVLTGDESVNQHSDNMAAASVLVLDANNRPIQGKSATPVLVDSSGTALDRKCVGSCVFFFCFCLCDIGLCGLVVA